MPKDIPTLVHRLYGIALSIVTLITGARFIIGCYGLYTAGKAAGGQIYSRAAVAQAFAPMALSAYLCLALVIGGFILHQALPLQKKKAAPEKNCQLILDRLHTKTDMERIDPILRELMTKQQKNRRLHTIISAVLLAVFSAAFLIYACIPGRWPDVSQVTGAMVQAVIVLACSLVIPTCYTIFTAYYCRRSLDLEIRYMRIAAKQAPCQKQVPAAVHDGKLYLVIRYGILAVAVAFIIFGYCSGGIADVIAKAAAICTECVGLG